MRAEGEDKESSPEIPTENNWKDSLFLSSITLHSLFNLLEREGWRNNHFFPPPSKPAQSVGQKQHKNPHAK